MDFKPLTIIKSQVVRTHMMRDKAPYPEKAGILFITVFPASSTMPETQYTPNQQMNE